MDDASILNELRSLVLSKTCIRSVTPADCKKIAVEISQTLHRTLSETTIKRIFGFAHSQHNFSKFTLAALAEYVDMHPGHTVYDGWQDIDSKASLITTNTINGIKSRSELPFKMTISRDFAASDLQQFQQSECSFTAFISPPAYGRSILMSHLAEQIRNQQLTGYHNTTLLFITARDLFEKTEQTIVFEERVKMLLGIHPNESLIQYADLNYEQSGKSLTIFIDGFCELELKSRFREQLIESIFGFVQDLGDSKSIRMVMSMRSHTWKRYAKVISQSTLLTQKWFCGTHYNPDTYSNVPCLNDQEIENIFLGIEDAQTLNKALRQEFRFPLNISLYHQILEEKSYLSEPPEITAAELTAQYVRNKIYRSNYYTEKIHFLRKIIHLTNFGKKGPCAPKEMLITDLSAFRNAYLELLSDGILSEDICESCASAKQTVCFSHAKVFDYFLQIELLISNEKGLTSPIDK